MSVRIAENWAIKITNGNWWFAFEVSLGITRNWAMRITNRN